MVAAGGAANRLDKGPARKVFTHTGNSNLLTAEENALTETNTKITPEMLK
jgi:hypothetical protein